MFVGRQFALGRLEGLWKKSTSSLVTVRGRRRIGKSTLVGEFARRTADHFIAIDGQAPGEGIDNRTQLKSFVEQLSLQTNAPDVPVKSWLQAFQLLENSLPKDGRIVILLDEISWMGGYDPAFAGTLKIVWDKRLKMHDNLVLVLCGSVSSWIAENILSGTGFVGRDSLDLVIDELALRECVPFWHEAAERTGIGEMLDFLSVSGGVPKYLEELKPQLSADENVRQLCFSPDGILYRDFDQIFCKIFGKKSEDRKDVLKAVAYGSKTIDEVSATLGKKRNGHLGDVLRELELAGFVAKDQGVNPRTGKVGRIVHYRLKDNYVRFYLHHIEPHAREIAAGLFGFESMASLQGWATIRGLQFENLIVSNYRMLLPILGIDGASLVSAAPYRRGRIGDEKGVQVDLLVQTKSTAYVIEIKRQAKIDAGVVDEINDKVGRLGYGPSTSVRTVLVYEGDLAPSIRLDHALDFIIPAERLFE